MESFKENTPMPKIKNSEVNELKNIKYKTNTKTSHDTDLSQVELFLENEKKNNQSEPWSKLDKTTRYKKVEEFAIAYTEKNNIADTSDLIFFFKRRN